MRNKILFAAALATVGSALYALPQLRGPGSELAPRGADASPPPTAIPEAKHAIALPAAPRVFSADQPALSMQPPGAALVTTTTKVVPSAAAGSIRPAVPTTTAPILVTNPDQSQRRLSSSRPADEDARRELVKDLQRELKRVGCYDGDVNGTWAPAAKKAMAMFTDRVNAALPLDEPDYILLTLIQGHGSNACGKGCPAGQGLNTAGKCVPSAILAQTSKRAVDKAASVAASATEPPFLPAAADTSRSTKQPASAQPPAGNSNASTWSTVVNATPQPPAQVTIAPVPQVARPAPAIEPLPGRMAVGAPVPPAVLPPAAQSDAERTKAELARRKAELTAAAEAQRAAEAEAEADRRARIAEAQTRRAARDIAVATAREAQAARLARAKAGAEAEQRSGQPADDKTAPQAAAASAAIGDNAAIAAAARRDILGRVPAKLSDKRVIEAPLPLDPAQQPAGVVRTPEASRALALQLRPLAPRYGAPYALGVPPAPAPRAAYQPQPSNWKRSIFNDINRMR